MASTMDSAARELDLELFVTEGLGDNTYLLASGDEALIIDPQRDVGRFLAVAEERRVTVRGVLETHVHNDYVSGALEIAARTGAEVAAPVKGNYAFPHRGLAEKDEVAIGDLRVVAIETPGHTPEHLAYLVYRSGHEDPLAAFTGGSLLVGNAGRTDLLGRDRAEELARLQFASLRRLASLPATARILPTHGAGSFCVATGQSGDRTSTVEEERQANTAIRAPDADTFVREQLTGLPDYPAYYRHMAPINRAGPRVLGEIPEPAPLGAEEVARLMDEGVWLVDARDRADFAAGHVPGSIHIELGPMFGSYLGWVIPFGDPVALVLPPEGGREAATQLARVGYDDVRGHLDGGIDSWMGAGRPVSSFLLMDVDALCEALRSDDPPVVLDVRQDVEHRQVALAGSTHIPLGELPHRTDDVPPDGEVWAICATGLRSATAASLVERQGRSVRLVTPGGVKQVVARCPDARA
jgi:hydroxyacylglutathione hydrolase